MIIACIVAGLILAIAFGLLAGQWGGLLMLAILSGFLFNIYFRNRQILQELQLIKEKLGIDKDNSADYKMDNEAIEAELEREHRDPDKNI